MLWGALLLGWLQLTPLYRAADEPTHADLVLRLRDGGSYAAPGTLDVDPRVRASFPLTDLSTAERPELPDHFPLPLSSTDVPPRDLSYDELPAAQGLAPYRNQMTQHPPLYYLLLAGGSRLLPGFGGWSFPVQLGALRLLSALLLLALPAVLLIAFGFASLGMAITSYMKTFQQMDWINFVMLPMFLFSATFYPLSVYPQPIQWLIQALPLWHGVELVRGLTTGELSGAMLGHVAYYVAMIAVGVVVTTRRLRALFLD